MARLLLIKTTSNPLKAVGDIIGIFEDSHKFSEHEVDIFNIINVPESRKELVTRLRKYSPRISTAYKTTDNKWELVDTAKVPPKAELIDVWEDSAGKWRALEIDRFYEFSLADLSLPDLFNLKATSVEKESVLAKMAFDPSIVDEKNTAEITDLNTDSRVIDG